MKKNFKLILVWLMTFVIYAGIIIMLYNTHRELIEMMLSMIGSYYIGHLAAKFSKWIVDINAERRNVK